jgi:preprotein translocase subunit SecG
VENELPPEPNPHPTPEPEAVPQVPAQIAVSAAVATPSAEDPAVAAPPAYRDRSTGLVVFGIVEIIVGLLSGLMIPLAVLGAVVSRLNPGGGMRVGQIISGVSIYAFIAAGFLCLGIGSIQYKRWARALSLITSCYWLLSGTLLTVLMTAVLPLMMRTILQRQENTNPGASQEMTTGVMAVMLTFIIVFMAFFLIVLPIAFIVFYSRKDVAETCRHRDPVERWTDRSPLPVLGGSVVLAVGAVYLLVTAVTVPLFPFFGRYLYGISGAACLLGFAILDGSLAVAFYRLKSAGWWIAIFSLPVRLISMAITYGRADLMQAYSKMGLSDAQLQAYNSSPLSRSHVFLWWSLLSSIIIYAYLLWLKRYFKAESMPQQPEALPVQIG